MMMMIMTMMRKMMIMTTMTMLMIVMMTMKSGLTIVQTDLVSCKWSSLSDDDLIHLSLFPMFPPKSWFWCKRRWQGCFSCGMTGLWGLNKENGLWVDGASHCCENTKAGPCNADTAQKLPPPAFGPFSYLYLIDLSRPWAPFWTRITI